MNSARGQDRRRMEFGALGSGVERREMAERRQFEVRESSMEEFEAWVAAMNARRAATIEPVILDWGRSPHREQ